MLGEDALARGVEACEDPRKSCSHGLNRQVDRMVGRGAWQQPEETPPLSCVAAGWTESATSKGESDEIGERDDVDGRSKEELEPLKTNQSDTGEDVSAQAESQ